MSHLDDRIRRGLERLAAPAEPTDVFDGIERRKRHHAVMRRVQRGVLVVAVIAGSAGGAFALNQAFQGDGTRLGEEPSGPRLIAFTRSAEDGSEHIFVMREDGSGIRQLTFGPNEDYGPSWSPDGTRIAFSRHTPGYESDIYVLSLVDGSLTRLTANPSTDDYFPAWSPDGDSIAFSRRTVDDVYSLTVMDPDGENVRTVPTEGHVLSLAWSPDGTRMALSYHISGDEVSVGVMDVATETVTLLTESDDVREWFPAWSPDGDLIAYNAGADIWLTDPQGVTQTNITASVRGAANTPAWSPEGDIILFGGRGGLFSIEPDPDATATQVTRGPDAMPAWQPVPTPVPVPGPTASPSPSPKDDPFTMPEYDPECGPYRRLEPTLEGDIDGDGQPEPVAVVDPCGYALVVEKFRVTSPDHFLGFDAPSWVHLNPRLLALVELNGEPGLEIVVELSVNAVYRTAAVFTMMDALPGGVLTRMKFEGFGNAPANILPIGDELPIGVDCAQVSTGAGIVITRIEADFAQIDQGLDPVPFLRTYYRAEGRTFVPEREEQVEISAEEVRANSGASVYPELGGTPFLSCPDRVD